MQDDLLTRGVDEIIPQADFAEALKSGRKLRIKFGVDPSRPDIHLGHTGPLRIMRRLQDMGHTIIFLIGDTTARIGDPSGRSKTRPVLTDAEIKANAQTYLDQVGKILDVKKSEIRRNSEWLDKLNFAELLKLAGQFSVAQLIEREDFKKRLAAGQELGLHELLYPVMQAYDSVALKADVEFGGSDQRFNILAGRALQKKLGQRPQIVFLTKLLVGTDGKEKMSKSLDNYIGITEAPHTVYGKVMSIPDALIAPYYELCTEVAPGVITELVKTLAAGANPRDAKASLAREIVRQYHGDVEAAKAEDGWNQTFRDKKGPAKEQVETIKATGSAKLLDVLVAAGASGSKSQVRILVAQRGIRLNGTLVTDPEVRVKPGDMVNIGKTRFFSVTK